MEIRNNKTEIPLAHYRARFAQENPEEMSVRSGAVFDRETGAFSMHMVGRRVCVSWPEGLVSFPDSTHKSNEYLSILLLRYLLEGRCTERSGKFLAYQEMPWGEVYYTQFRGRCILRLAFGFGHDPERFSRACAALGGMPVPMADRAFEVPFLEELRVRLLLWEGDEEFQPSAQILFSDNFPLSFSAEDIAVVGDVLISEMKNVDMKETESPV